MPTAEQHPASFVCMWPSGPIYTCFKHASQLLKIADAMGISVSVSTALPGHSCANCERTPGEPKSQQAVASAFAESVNEDNQCSKWHLWPIITGFGFLCMGESTGLATIARYIAVLVLAFVISSRIAACKRSVLYARIHTKDEKRDE